MSRRTPPPERPTDPRRRAWLQASLALGAWAALAPRSARAQSPQKGGEKDQDEAPAARARMLLIGDSMIAGGFGLYLAQDLERDHGILVERHGKSSTGLARPDFYDWVEVGAELVDAHKPDVVACMFGGNDGQGLYMGRKADPKWIRYEEEGWTAEYRRRVNAFADAVTPQGQHLLWIGMPVMKPSKLHGRVSHMNTIYRAEMAIRPQATFIDIWRTLAKADGGYTDHIEVEGKRARVRAGDGVHMSRTGAHYLADYVQLEFLDALGLPPGGAADEAEPDSAKAAGGPPLG